jgi:hypothetical protein
MPLAQALVGSKQQVKKDKGDVGIEPSLTVLLSKSIGVGGEMFVTRYSRSLGEDRVMSYMRAMDNYVLLQRMIGNEEHER